jgi:DNA-nicking Smr family endonuclease
MGDRGRPAIPEQSDASLGHQPFRVLRQLVAVAAARAPVAVAPKPVPRRSPADVDGAELFRSAVADVTPLAPAARSRVAGAAPAQPQRAVTHPDAEALAELSDLVSGNAPFDISSSDEHIEGAVLGLDPRLLRRLRAGAFAYQAHLDLHGMTTEEARSAVEAFLLQAHQNGKRCVLIVHGRGRNSQDQVPVLKRQLTNWLARGQWTRLVLAFTSARGCDGGVGALYVLLRRRREARRPIRVTAGAKW